MGLFRHKLTSWTREIRFIVIGLLFLAGSVNAQNLGHLSDPNIRGRRVGELMSTAKEKHRKAWQSAQTYGWSPKWTDGQTVYELMAIEDDYVCVYKTCNQNARISIAVDQVQGVFPYNLSGQEIVVGVWDGGNILTTHQELLNRVNILEISSFNSHATHVAGTIGAAGIVAQAMGMAPAVVFDSYYFNFDEAEMTARAMSYSGEPGKIAISNHSYGIICGWDYSTSPPRWYGQWGDGESDSFGKYTADTQSWDQICYGAPYYLPVKAAGNDRGDHAPAEGVTFEYYKTPFWRTKSYDSTTDPYGDGWDNGGFDTIMPVSSAKNILTVGAVTDAVYNGQRDISRASMTSFSGWGPVDDGRIKPDVVTNGDLLYGPTATSNSAYASYSGTSMATAVATGAAALLTEYHRNLFAGQYMRASSLKAIMIHAADDMGRSGPDYTYGWGLLNIHNAAEILRNQADFPDRAILIEHDILSTELSNVYTLQWSGNQPIKATLCWTDPAAGSQSNLDDRTSRLVNDLDLRIYGPNGITYSPFVLNVLNPALAATNGDNITDNVEQVYIPNPDLTGQYTVVVSRKGYLTNQHQVYSLVLTGHRLAPLAINDLSGTVGSNCGQVELSWSPVAEAGGYKVFYKEGSAQPPFVPDVDGTPGSGTDLGDVNSVTISDLDPTSSYYFVVQAYNSGGAAELSNPVCVTPNASCLVSISGKIETSGGNGIADATLMLVGFSNHAVTGPDGTYTLFVPIGWTDGIVRVTKTDWWFEPAERFYAGPLQDNLNQQDYLGKRWADFNEDGIVALEDYALLANWWLADSCRTNENCEHTDLDLSGAVDLQDLWLFVSQWLDVW